MTGRGEVEQAPQDGEYAPLLGNPEPPDETVPQSRKQEYWVEFVATFKYAIPLMITNVLQYSLRLIPLLFAGRLGKLELGAVALASMTANITGYAPLQGFATALDTLCPEAFASGSPLLVGLYCQRVMYMLLIMSCLVAALWTVSRPLLALVIPSQDLVDLTAVILQINVAALPGYLVFEVGKRYIRSQGSAMPMLYFLGLGIPLNVLLHWVFIYVCGWGVLGAPVALAVTHTFMAITMMIYMRFSKTIQCWDGLQKRAFKNWRPIVVLALPDLIMIEVDALSWEILVLMSAYLSDEELAAQTVLGSIMALAFQTPFPLSIASSFQIASAIGQKNTRRASVNSIIALITGTLFGLINLTIMITLQRQIPTLFSADSDVQKIAARILPLLAVVQVFDSISVVGNGVLRGLGRQKIGSIAMLVCYYLIGIPFSAGSAFGLNWRLNGMWIGILIAVFGVSLVDIIAIWRLDFKKCVERSAHRTTNA